MLEEEPTGRSPGPGAPSWHHQVLIQGGLGGGGRHSKAPSLSGWIHSQSQGAEACSCPFLLSSSLTLLPRLQVLIGCDGVNSVVAKWLGLKVPAFAGRYAARGIATFPDGHAINPEFAQHFGTGYRSGMLPCDKKSVYWFFTWTSDGEGW